MSDGLPRGYHEYRAFGAPHHPLGRRAEDEPVYPRLAERAHDDDVGVGALDDLEYLLVRLARDHVGLDVLVALELLGGEALEHLGSGGHELPVEPLEGEV